MCALLPNSIALTDLSYVYSQGEGRKEPAANYSIN